MLSSRITELIKFIDSKKIHKSSLFKKYPLEIQEYLNKSLNIYQIKVLLKYIQDHNDFPKCTICNKSHHNFRGISFNKTCSKLCANELIKTQTKKAIIEKYGVENVFQSKEIKDKIKQTNLERRGVENPQQNKDIQNKTKQTNLSKYGVENPQQNKDIKNKTKQTNLEKYGCENAYSNIIVQNKTKQTCFEKYGAFNYRQSNHSKITSFNNFLNKFNIVLNLRKLSLINITDQKKLLFALKCNVCSHEFELNYNNQIFICCRKCNPYSRSKLESEIYNYLILNNLEVFSNDRKTIKNKESSQYLELDLFISKYNLAIEINGIYYHSIKDLENDILKKDYHLNKYLLCKNQSIKLLQFTDLDFINKSEICYSIINQNLNLNQSKIFARKCSIQVVSNQESKIFLQENHIQGYVNSSINLGLFYENNLVQIMTFGHSRFNKSYTYELIRLASKLNTQILGGSEKLFKRFKENYLKENQSIISYCDISKFSGTVYSKLGFKFLHQTSPNYFYYKKSLGILESRQKYQKHKLSSILENFDHKLTEKQNMLNNGYSIYYDCGNKVFLYAN